MAYYTCGKACFHVGSYDVAILCCSHCQAIMSRLLAPQHPLLILPLTLMGVVHC